MKSALDWPPVQKICYLVNCAGLAAGLLAMMPELRVGINSWSYERRYFIVGEGWSGVRIMALKLGSGSRPRFLISTAEPDPGFGAFLPLDTGSRAGIRNGKKIRIRDEHPGSHFRELRKNLLGWKYLNSLMGIRDPFDPGSGMEKFGSVIRKKHPGSATLTLMNRKWKTTYKWKISSNLRNFC